LLREKERKHVWSTPATEKSAKGTGKGVLGTHQAGKKTFAFEGVENTIKTSGRKREKPNPRGVVVGRRDEKEESRRGVQG